MCGEHRVRAATGERRVPREHLVRHDAECVDVGPCVGRRITSRLFRRHVRRRPECDADRRQRRTRRGIGDRLRHAEIGDDGRVPGEQDVVGLDVAMRDAFTMRVLQCACDVSQNPDRFRDRQLTAREAGAQRFAVDERHDVVRQSVELPHRQQGDDVRVLQPRRDADLALEARNRDGPRALVGQELRDHATPEREVFGDEDVRHAAATELRFEPVVVAERCLKLVAKVCHLALRARQRSIRGPTQQQLRPRLQTEASHSARAAKVNRTMSE